MSWHGTVLCQAADGGAEPDGAVQGSPGKGTCSAKELLQRLNQLLQCRAAMAGQLWRGLDQLW